MMTEPACRWAWLEATIRHIQEELEAGKMSCTEADLQRSNAALLAVYGTFYARDKDGNEHEL